MQIGLVQSMEATVTLYASAEFEVYGSKFMCLSFVVTSQNETVIIFIKYSLPYYNYFSCHCHQFTMTITVNCHLTLHPGHYHLVTDNHSFILSSFYEILKYFYLL